ncbi:MAG: hypothetical protein M1281_19630 [Chloroflexi bacterium]|nr:hypothetical protein [Chloroflexota bacterium]
MAEQFPEIETKAETEEEPKQNSSELHTLSDRTEGDKRDWKSIAEVRMVMYVVPVAIVFVIIAWLMSHYVR